MLTQCTMVWRSQPYVQRLKERWRLNSKRHVRETFCTGVRNVRGTIATWGGGTVIFETVLCQHMQQVQKFLLETNVNAAIHCVHSMSHLVTPEQKDACMTSKRLWCTRLCVFCTKICQRRLRGMQLQRNVKQRCRWLNGQGKEQCWQFERLGASPLRT